MDSSPPRRRAIVALCLLLAACATPAPLPSPARPPRASISSFSLEGRIAVHKGDSRYSASVSWQHGRNRDSLLFSGPLGQGLAELVRDGDGARLTLSDHRQYAADSLDELSAKVFGFPLPLSGMAHWVVGNAPQGAAHGRDEQGRPQRLAAEGWAIDLLAWETDRGDALPSLLELRRDDLEVRLKILDWQDVR